jgi:hypothetical protein
VGRSRNGTDREKKRHGRSGGQRSARSHVPRTPVPRVDEAQRRDTNAPNGANQEHPTEGRCRHSERRVPFLLARAALTLLIAWASAPARGRHARRDGDGIYCEALPCPCARAAPTEGEEPASALRRARARRTPRARRPARPHAQCFEAQIIDVTDGDNVRVRSRDTRRRT